MIDFIKIYTPQKEKIEANIKERYTDVICSMNYSTGEVVYPCRFHLENLDVRITNTKAIIRNSIHKYYNMVFNQSANNYTDFHYNDFVKSLNNLKDKLGDDIYSYKLTNLEFGFNIEVPDSPELLLERNFVMFNCDSFNQIETFRGKGYYKQYNRSEYYIKFYDKGKQFGLENNLMRVEIKVIESDLLKRLGIVNLSDLRCLNKLKRLFEFFVKRIEETNIVDYPFGRNIPKKDKDLLNAYKSPAFWSELKASKSSTTYHKTKNHFNKLLQKYNLLTIKEHILEALIMKFDFLTQNIGV